MSSPAKPFVLHAVEQVSEGTRIKAINLVQWIGRADHYKNNILDAQCVPLIEALVSDGVLPDANTAFVEAQGAWEFSLVAIFWGERGQHCFNLYPETGKIDHCA